MLEVAFGTREALQWFNAQVYAWSEAFSKYADSQFAWTLGKAMDARNHSWAIRRQSLRKGQGLVNMYAERWSKTEPEPRVNERTIRRWTDRLAEFGVLKVTNRKQDFNGKRPGTQLSNLYEVSRRPHRRPAQPRPPGPGPRHRPGPRLRPSGRAPARNPGRPDLGPLRLPRPRTVTTALTRQTGAPR
jgi:hypothetical protein